MSKKKEHVLIGIGTPYDTLEKTKAMLLEKGPENVVCIPNGKFQSTAFNIMTIKDAAGLPPKKSKGIDEAFRELGISSSSGFTPDKKPSPIHNPLRKRYNKK